MEVIDCSRMSGTVRLAEKGRGRCDSKGDICKGDLAHHRTESQEGLMFRALCRVPTQRVEFSAYRNRNCTKGAFCVHPFVTSQQCDCSACLLLTLK